MKNQKTLLLIDGDVVAFRTAAAAEVRTIEVTHKPTGIKKEFKNRTEFKKIMKAKDKEITEDYCIDDLQTAEEVDAVNKVLSLQIKNLVNEVEADEYQIFIGGSDNFRDKLLLPSKYKGSREDTIRPLRLKDAKNHLLTTHRGILVNGREADDMLSIAGYEGLSKGYKVVLATNDKDSRQSEDLYIYDFTKDSPQLELMPEFGELRLIVKGTNKTIKGEGLLFGCFQWLAGDPTDGYQPYELSKEPYGPMKAYQDLRLCTTPKEALEKVLEVYQTLYPEPFRYTAWNGVEVEADWRQQLELYFACWYMQRSMTDNSKPNKLFSKYGVFYE